MKTSLLIALSIAALVACSNPKDVVIPTDANQWETQLQPSVDRLSGTDRQLAVSYLDRIKSAASASGRPIDSGVTLGQAIDQERQYEDNQSKQRLADRGQQDKLDQQRKENEDRAAQVFSVKLTGKELIPADLSSGNLSDQVKFSFEFQNTGSAPIAEVVGTLHVADNFFGTELKTIPLDYQQPLQPGEIQAWDISLPLSPQAIIDQRVRNTDLSQMQATLTPRRIAFADGTSMDFAAA